MCANNLICDLNKKSFSLICDFIFKKVPNNNGFGKCNFIFYRLIFSKIFYLLPPRVLVAITPFVLSIILYYSFNFHYQVNIFVKKFTIDHAPHYD